ncbi:MAG: hypothetical protein BMS9Abin34_058 [Patescibacteria group bacterium]|nr:MAG: hypothetical protein BMS9Abin34_058 [Patescibacteria group bacterium]
MAALQRAFFVGRPDEIGPSNFTGVHLDGPMRSYLATSLAFIGRPDEIVPSNFTGVQL